MRIVLSFKQGMKEGVFLGTDIHCFVEQKMYRTDTYETDTTGKWIWINKTNHAGTWISIDKWTKDSMAILYPERNEGPVWMVEREDMVFTDRNYDLFAILANQRNPENMPFISEPRGLPEDVSPEIPPQIRVLEGHDTTWFTEYMDINKKIEALSLGPLSWERRNRTKSLWGNVSLLRGCLRHFVMSIVTCCPGMPAFIHTCPINICIA